jgi:chromosome segregation ATPase
MRSTVVGIVALLMLACSLSQGAFAAEEDTVARVKEMLHRTQEALRQAQSDNAELTRTKTEAEQKLLAATKQLDTIQSGSKTAQISLRAQLLSAQGAQADLGHKLSDSADRLSTATTQLRETTKQLAARDAELARAKQGLEQSKAANDGCENKNLTLYGYSEALLDRYQHKGVWAALAQKDPLLGLKEVDVENVVQEYRLKFAGQKIKP